MKARLILLVMVALLVGAGLVGCGPKKDGTTQTPTSAPTPSETPKTTPSLGGSALPDMPIYPSLRQIPKPSQIMPPTVGYKADIRAYETNDSVEKVADFYKSQMPAKGWVETHWVDTPQLKNGSYSKNSETDLAVVWVFGKEGKTEVILWRGTKE